jgi:hypothetical protein
MRRVSILILIVLFVAFWAGSASAASRYLRGAYNATGTSGGLVSLCQFAKGNFAPNLSPACDTHASSASMKSVFIFNRDGTGRFQSTDVGTDFLKYHDGTAAGGDPFSREVSCNFTYSLNGNQITIETLPGGTVTIAGGPATGFTLQPQNSFSLSGTVSADLNTITLSTPGLQVEEVDFYIGGSKMGTSYSVTHRHLVLIR